MRDFSGKALCRAGVDQLDLLFVNLNAPLPNFPLKKWVKIFEKFSYFRLFCEVATIVFDSSVGHFFGFFAFRLDEVGASSRVYGATEMGGKSMDASA